MEHECNVCHQPFTEDELDDLHISPITGEDVHGHCCPMPSCVAEREGRELSAVEEITELGYLARLNGDRELEATVAFALSGDVAAMDEVHQILARRDDEG